MSTADGARTGSPVASRLSGRATELPEPSAARRILAWLYVTNGVVGLVLPVWFLADALWGANDPSRAPFQFAVMLGAFVVWALSNLWIGLRLREGSRRGVIAAAVLNVLSSLVTLPAPSEAPVAVGVSVMATIGLAMVWHELAPAVVRKRFVR